MNSENAKAIVVWTVTAEGISGALKTRGALYPDVWESGRRE